MRNDNHPTTNDASVPLALPEAHQRADRQWMTMKVGQCVTSCATCGDVIVIEPGEKPYCELHEPTKGQGTGITDLSPAGQLALQGIMLKTGESSAAEVLERLLFEEAGRVLATYFRKAALHHHS